MFPHRCRYAADSESYPDIKAYLAILGLRGEDHPVVWMHSTDPDAFLTEEERAMEIATRVAVERGVELLLQWKADGKG